MPRPENRVAAFLLGALSGPSAPGSRRVDVRRYWEKRRVQNGVRRLLESLQEHHQGSLGAAFVALSAHGASGGKVAETPVLDAQRVSRSLEALGLWPPELNSNDHAEIITALQVPCLRDAEAVFSGQRMRSELSKRNFCEAFNQVPFNLPDFPVPVHLMPPALRSCPGGYSSEQRYEVLEALVAAFGGEQGGLGLVKDFFDSGLVSLEEIQVALPRLYPRALLEDSVATAIRCGAALMSHGEWVELVQTPREDAASSSTAAAAPGATAEASPAAALRQEVAAAAPTPEGRGHRVSLASPGPQHRNAPLPGGQRLQDSLTPPKRQIAWDRAVLAPASPGGGDGGASCEASGGPAGSAEVARELVTEAGLSWEPRRLERVVDWNTAGPVGAQHQADQGAGGVSRGDWGTGIFKKELAHGKRVCPEEEEEEEEEEVDHFAWINLDLQHECAGPYLARAFVRCCQLYRRRQLVNLPPGRRAALGDARRR